VALPYLIYGAYGYTGTLLAEEAVRRGQRPVLAGRDPDRVGALADRLDLPRRVFALDEAAVVANGLDGVCAVLHCAGPFSRTALPMVRGCLEHGVHYLDVTGEIEVFAAIHEHHQRAVDAGIMLMPGVGFDVVPSDCLAAHLAGRLPTANRLVLAIQGVGNPSRGTATTMAENMGGGGMIRRGGVLTPVPAAWRTRTIDFGHGPVPAMTIPWGDVYTAYVTTGIPEIEVYMAVPPSMRMVARASRYLGPLLRSRAFVGLARAAIRSRPPGPDAEQRRRGRSLLWGEATDPDGGRAVSRIEAPDGYDTTVLTSLLIVDRLLDGRFSVGFQTPAGCYGPDLILELEGFERVDVEPIATD
jgi:short subunit dehydrogenase-like uncharacterized protein